MIVFRYQYILHVKINSNAVFGNMKYSPAIDCFAVRLSRKESRACRQYRRLKSSNFAGTNAIVCLEQNLFSVATKRRLFWSQAKPTTWNPAKYEAISTTPRVVKMATSNTQAFADYFRFGRCHWKPKWNNPLPIRISSLTFPNTNPRERSFKLFLCEPDCSHTNAGTTLTKSGFVNNGQPIMAYGINETWISPNSVDAKPLKITTEPFVRNERRIAWSCSRLFVDSGCSTPSAEFLVVVERSRLRNELFHGAASEVQTKERIQGINTLRFMLAQSERYTRWLSEVYF